MASSNELFVYAGDHGIPLYVLIDEYDNFANTVLAYHGEEAYQAFTHGGGFYRNFFATLKDGTGHSGGRLGAHVHHRGVRRLPWTMLLAASTSAATSAWNQSSTRCLVSPRPRCGCCWKWYRDLGAFNQEVEAALAVMREWYNGYRFSEEAEVDIYNTDMVLYYLKYSIPNRGMPRELIDTNVRIDYGKLRHLLTVNRQLNGNFDLLRHIIGEQQVDSPIQLSFPLDQLDQRENFLSLLHYFGPCSAFGTWSAGCPGWAFPIKRSSG